MFGPAVLLKLNPNENGGWLSALPSNSKAQATGFCAHCWAAMDVCHALSSTGSIATNKTISPRSWNVKKFICLKHYEIVPLQISSFNFLHWGWGVGHQYWQIRLTPLMQRFSTVLLQNTSSLLQYELWILDLLLPGALSKLTEQKIARVIPSNGETNLPGLLICLLEGRKTQDDDFFFSFSPLSKSIFSLHCKAPYRPRRCSKLLGVHTVVGNNARTGDRGGL